MAVRETSRLLASAPPLIVARTSKIDSTIPRRMVAQSVRRGGKDIGNNKHGWYGYQSGCKCDICRTAQRVRMQRYRANRKRAREEYAA